MYILRYKTEKSLNNSLVVFYNQKDLVDNIFLYSTQRNSLISIHELDFIDLKLIPVTPVFRNGKLTIEGDF